MKSGRKHETNGFTATITDGTGISTTIILPGNAKVQTGDVPEVTITENGTVIVPENGKVTIKDESGRKTEIIFIGMSGDYEDTVREGATLVRLGTARFGSRPPICKSL